MIDTFGRLLREDIGFGDITSQLAIPEDLSAQAKVIAKEACLIAGLAYLSENVTKLGLKVTVLIKDGENAEKGDIVALIEGNARKVLAMERVFLNILGRMSGIATTTRRILNKINKTNPNVRIAATRKTLLGPLDKMAVIVGGGDPHRWNLSDHILIKDSHIALVGIEEAVKRVKKKSFIRKIEVEVETVEDAFKVMNLGVDIILLDNFKPKEVSQVVKELGDRGLKGKIILEASGGINEENVKEYAECGVDVISMGLLTHSTKSIDFSIETQRKMIPQV